MVVSRRRRAARPAARSLAARIEATKGLVAARLSDMDPGDLDLIVSSLLRPFGTGRHFFLREIRPGVRVF
jgi:hypothetical protein